jgi:dipeptidyl aminopeptidase/acylaminoacyl peptidase
MFAFSYILPLACAGLSVQTIRHEPIGYEDLKKLAFVFDPQISPDGSSIAYTYGNADFDQDRRQSEIRVYDVEGKRTRTLSVRHIAPNSPRWSPDGKILAFCAFDAEMNDQVYLYPLASGDILQVTHSGTGVDTYSWSPDGATIAYTAEEDRPPRTGSDRFNRSFEVGDDPYGVSSSPAAMRLWVTPVSGGEARCLGKAGRPLQEMLPPASATCPPVWSQDGKYLFVVSQKSPSYGDAWWTNRIERVTLVNGEMTPVTNGSGFELSVAASPTEDKIVYWAQTNTKSQMNRLYLSDGPGRPGRALSASFDVNEFLSVWMPDGRSILTGGNYEDTVGLWVLDLDGKAHRLDLGNAVPANSFGLEVSVSQSGAMAFAGSNPDSPSEIFYMASPDSKPVAITDANGWLADIPRGETRSIDWKSDGYRANGVITLPPAFDPKQRYPVVVELHGGPQDAAHRGFSIQSQFLAGKGFIVFEPNYRGSDNLGERYMQAIWNDAGNGPSRDVMAGLKQLERESWVDSSKESLSGWSYGGFMTAWLMGHESRWKCAVCGAAILDWSAMRSLSDFGPMVDLGFRGKLWKDGLAKEYAKQSPISYVDRMKTPTLILADSGDMRVPTAQSFELYQGLREEGVPVKFVLYPVNRHSPGDPVQIVDVLRRTVDWLNQWSK